MNRPPLLLLLFVSSFAALLAFPVSPELAVSPVLISGLLLMMRADYGRRVRPLTFPAQALARRLPERLPFAA